MKTTTKLSVFAFLGLSFVAYYGQDYSGKVGINTDKPNATLEIKGKSDNTNNTLEGLVIPNVSINKTLQMGGNTSIKESTLIYVNDLSDYTTTPVDTKVVNINAKGYYYWDGITWVKLVNNFKQSANKTLVYTNNSAINYDILYPDRGDNVQFGSVPPTDPSFVPNTSLEANPDYLYITPDGKIWIWDISESLYVTTTEQVSGNSLFSQQNSVINDATGKTENMWRAGNIGIGIQTPIARLHTNGLIAGAYSKEIILIIDSSTGGNSPTDHRFSTVEEAVNYASQIVNNGTVRILLRGSSKTIDINKPLTISRNITIESGTVNINAPISLLNGATFGFTEGTHVVQNIPVAFSCHGRNKIALGGYYSSSWTFTANNQKIAATTYSGSNANDHIQFAFSRTSFLGTNFSGLGFASKTEETTGRYTITYWQTTLPSTMDYSNISNVLPSNNSSQNFVGDVLTFSGLDQTNGNTLIERARFTTNGNFGIGVTTPTEKLEVAGAIKIGTTTSTCTSANYRAIKFESDNFYGCKSTGWVLLNN
ncbi:hypothetical protein [Riemerella anatipestifer]|uniref:hypothetical protein n=1 Tax=Riemerella anatipestifer TaxID=34085 RepID=UPI00069C0AAA|nr:hypothetical protein [Riemerella anatipestifer]